MCDDKIAVVPMTWGDLGENLGSFNVGLGKVGREHREPHIPWRQNTL